MLIDCVVPFFNEKGSVASVVTTLSALPEINQVIAVDDGSTDQGGMSLEPIPKVKLVSLPNNQGKSAAINAALPEIKTDYVLLCDADVYGFDPERVSEGVKLLERSNLDMLVFRNVTDAWYVKWLGMDLILSGIRLIQKELLDKVCGGRVMGYGLELALTQEAIRSNWQVAWYPLPIKNYLKLKKWGVVKAIKPILKGLKVYINHQYIQSWWKWKGKIYSSH